MRFVHVFKQHEQSGKHLQTSSKRPTLQKIMNHRPALFISAFLVACLSIGITAGWQPAAAQSTADVTADLNFKIVNATTNEPGSVERLQIQLFVPGGAKIIDTQPHGSDINLPRVPMFDDHPYLITAWKAGVPYFWRFRGNYLIDEEQTLHVFDTSKDISGAEIGGLTVMFKQRESLADVEYMFSLQNSTKPQVTLIGSPSTVVMELPAGTTNLEAEYVRGPDPTPIKIHQLGDNKIGLEVPLVTGNNHFKVKGVMPWTGEAQIPVNLNLPVKKWSISVSPESLDIQAFELVPDRENTFPGFQRLIGPELTPGRGFNVRVAHVGADAPKENLFSQEIPQTEEQSADATKENAEGSLPVGYILLAAAIILIIGLIVRSRTRRK